MHIPFIIDDDLISFIQRLGCIKAWHEFTNGLMLLEYYPLINYYRPSVLFTQAWSLNGSPPTSPRLRWVADFDHSGPPGDL